MDGCEWVSGNVANGWASEMRDDIAWQECVRYGINIFLDALKFYNIWPLQEKVLWFDFKRCENRLRHIRIIEWHKKWMHPGWCLSRFIGINSNTLLENDVKWPMCNSNLDTNVLLLSRLIACPHCVYSLCRHNFFSTVHSSIRLFSVWPTGEKAAESVGAICLQ